MYMGSGEAPSVSRSQNPVEGELRSRDHDPLHLWGPEAQVELKELLYFNSRFCVCLEQAAVLSDHWVKGKALEILTQPCTVESLLY